MNQILVLGSVGREKIYAFQNVSPIVFGGTAFYATEAILKGGSNPPLIIAPLGHDLEPDLLVSQFSRKVPTAGLYQNTNLPSFYWEARYENSFEESKTIALENRLIDAFNPNWANIRSNNQNIEYCYLAAFDPRIQKECAKEFENSFIILETLEYWIERDRNNLMDAITLSNGLIVTESEFRALWQIDTFPGMQTGAVTDIIDRYNLDFLIVTFADRGSQVFDQQRTLHVPALSCTTIDSTGAGNAFSGGIISYLSQHGPYNRNSLYKAAVLGTALAGLQVQDFSNHALKRATRSEIYSLEKAIWRKIDLL